MPPDRHAGAGRRAAAGRSGRRRRGRWRAGRRRPGGSLKRSGQPGFAEGDVADAAAAPGIGQMDTAIAAELQGRGAEVGGTVAGRFDVAGPLPALAVVLRQP
ncbi:MAG: hypothetical protein F9K30_18665 [Dechloromonas sp.]|nr:MAG: hypothetical protein F9K30_18665 [Dechloromonas sp.]